MTITATSKAARPLGVRHLYTGDAAEQQRETPEPDSEPFSTEQVSPADALDQSRTVRRTPRYNPSINEDAPFADAVNQTREIVLDVEAEPRERQILRRKATILRPARLLLFIAPSPATTNRPYHNNGDTMQRIQDVMTTNPTTYPSTTTLIDAARTMRDSDVGDVLVERNGALVGVVTDRDIVVRAVAEARNPSDVRLGDICSRALTTLTPNDSVDDAVRLMRDNALRRLPICKAASPSASSPSAISPSNATPTPRSPTSPPRHQTRDVGHGLSARTQSADFPGR